MASRLHGDHGIVIRFEPPRRRVAGSDPAARKGELLYFPRRVGLHHIRSGQEAAVRDEAGGAWAYLAHAVTDINMAAVQATLQFASPIGWMELQQRVGREHVSACIGIGIALLQILAPMTAESRADASGSARYQYGWPS